MNLKQLQCFVVSADVGSLSKAAQLLYMTQSNISKTIDRLEKELNKTLLIRTKSGVSLTKEGRNVYPIARKVLADAEKLRQFSEGKKQSVLAMAAMPSRVMSTIFAEFYQMLRTEVKRTTELKYLEGSLEIVLNNVTHRHAPFGLIYISELQKEALYSEIKKKRLEFHMICQSEFRLYVGPQNPFFEKKHISIEEMSLLNFVQNREDRIPLLDYPGHLNSQGIRKTMLHKVAEVDSDHTMMQMLLKTDLANISNYISTDFALEKKIHSLIIDDCNVKAQFGYIKKIGDELSDTERELLDYIRKRLVKKEADKE